MIPLKELPAWKTLEQHFKAMRTFDMRIAFRDDPYRFEQLSLRCGSLLLDYSKNRVAPNTMQNLMRLARDSELETQHNAMFSGERINFTEQRAVLHTALRAPVRPPRVVEGVDAETTLFIVASKTFTTLETLANVNSIDCAANRLGQFPGLAGGRA